MGLNSPGRIGLIASATLAFSLTELFRLLLEEPDLGIELLNDALQHLFHAIVTILRLTAASMDECRGEDDEREQLEELRLPVLQRGLSELHEEFAGLRSLVVIALFLDEGPPLGKGLAAQLTKNRMQSTMLNAEFAQILRTLDDLRSSWIVLTITTTR